MDIIAHRGASSLAPENTLLAVDKALQLDASFIEVDCRLTGDNKIIVFHDEDTSQFPGMEQAAIDGMPYDTLRSYDLGDGQYMPLLEEVLEHINGACNLIIESKYQQTAQEIIPLITRCSWKERISFTSSFASELLTVKKLFPSMPVSYVIDKHTDELDIIYQAFGIRQYSIDRRLISPDWVSACKKQGFGIRVFTVNDMHDALQLESWGIDGIFTDYPQLFLKPKVVHA